MSCIVWPQIWEPQALLGAASLGTMGAKERLPFLEIQGVEVVVLPFLGQYYSNSSAPTVSHNSKYRTVFEQCVSTMYILTSHYNKLGRHWLGHYQGVKYKCKWRYETFTSMMINKCYIQEHKNLR
jgi:hypothetical protein